MAKKQPVKEVPKVAFVMPTLPRTLKIDPLFASLLHLASFLELSDEDAVDPDWSVEAMESVGAYLQKMSPEQVEEIQSQLGRIVAHARKKKLNPDFIEFAAGFLENFGIGDELEDDD
jgi:hypothetical protein